MIMEAKPTQYAASPSRRSRASESFEAEQSIRVLTLAWGGPAADAGWTPCSLRSHGADRSLRTLAYIALDELRILDQVEELRGCDKRLTACMLNRLGDLQL